MPEMSAQFDFWGGSTIGSTRTMPVRQGNEVVAPTKRRGKDPEQLPMFMTAREIDASTYPGDMIHRGPNATPQDRIDF